MPDPYTPTGWLARYSYKSSPFPVSAFDSEGCPLVLDLSSTPEPKLRKAVDLKAYGRLRLEPAHQPLPRAFVPAAPGWRVRTEDDDGKTIVLPIAAWGSSDDGTLLPFVVDADREELDEADDDSVILQPGEPDDAEVGEDE